MRLTALWLLLVGFVFSSTYSSSFPLFQLNREKFSALFVPEIAGKALKSLPSCPALSRTLSVCKEACQDFLNSVKGVEAAPMEIYESRLREIVSNCGLKLNPITENEVAFFRLVTLRYFDITAVAVSVLENSVTSFMPTYESKQSESDAKPFKAVAAYDLRDALVHQIEELFARKQLLFLSRELEAPSVVALLKSFPAKFAAALDNGLITPSATLSQAEKALGDFSAENFLSEAIFSPLEEECEALDNEYDTIYKKTLFRYLKAPLQSVKDYMVLVKIAKIPLAQPLELLSPEAASNLRSFGLEPFSKEFLVFLRKMVLHFLNQDLAMSEKRWKNTGLFAEEFISRTHFSLSEARQVNFAVLWRLFDLLKEKKFTTELTKICSDSNLNNPELFVEAVKNHLTQTFFIGGNWDEVLQGIQAKIHIQLVVQSAHKAHSHRFGNNCDEEIARKCVNWFKTQMIFKDRKGRVFDLWNEAIISNSSDVFQAANTLDGFVAELNASFEQEVLSEIEVIGELSPSAPQLVELLLAFPAALIAVSPNLNALKTFAEIHEAVNSLFEARVRTALKRNCGFAEDFELLDEIFLSKAQEFAGMSRVALQKHFSTGHSGLRNENDYANLMNRLGLDLDRPEDLFDDRLRDLLETLGFRLDDKAFQAVMKTIFALIWPRVDAPKQPVPLFEELNGPVQVGSLVPSSKRSLQNQLIVQNLSSLLYQQGFASEMSTLIAKLIGTDESASSYTDVIVKRLVALSLQPSVFQALPAGAKLPQKAQKIISESILQACQAFSHWESYGKVATRVAVWLNGKLFASSVKVKAVEKWNAQINEETVAETLVGISQFYEEAVAVPGSGKKSLLFAEENCVCEFDRDSSPAAISDSKGKRVESTSNEESAVPPFPFQSLIGESILPSREHLESTAKYLHDHGNRPSLQLSERKRIIKTSVALQLKSEFSDVNDEVLGQIFNIFQEGVDRVLK